MKVVGYSQWAFAGFSRFTPALTIRSELFRLLLRVLGKPSSFRSVAIRLLMEERNASPRLGDLLLVLIRKVWAVLRDSATDVHDHIAFERSQARPENLMGEWLFALRQVSRSRWKRLNGAIHDCRGELSARSVGKTFVSIPKRGIGISNGNQLTEWIAEHSIVLFAGRKLYAKQARDARRCARNRALRSFDERELSGGLWLRAGVLFWSGHGATSWVDTIVM